MVINIAERYQYELTNSQIREILNSLGIQNEFYEVILEKRNGRYILIKNSNKDYYVIFSSKNAQDGRNSFINQYIATVLQSFVQDQTQSKEIYVYLIDTTRYAETAYMIDTYKMLKNIGITILNEDNLSIHPIEPYKSVSEWKTARNERQDYNPGNNSTYVLENEDSYTIYGKSFGANGKEASLICCTIAQIARLEGKDVHLYQVEDNDASGLSSQDIKLLQYYGVIVEKSILPRFEPRQYLKQQVQETSRDQATFQLNLLNKYGAKKCFICGNTIEESIIASHIHRIADIDKSSLSWDEKCKAAVDPDNGFWLCANHDKMFEYGLFYFISQSLKISNQLKPLIDNLEVTLNRTVGQVNNDVLKNQIFEFVKRNNDLLVLKNFTIDTYFYSPSMYDYLELHRSRVNGY
jgi:hypothetical protein